MESSDIGQMDIDEESFLPFSEDYETYDSAFEDDFEQTIAMLDMDVEELTIEIQNSHEEVEGNKQFPCEFCEKICKSKGGRTRHQRSKHMAELGASSTSRNDVISMDKVKDIIRDIGRYLTDEKLYKPEQAAEVFKLEPSESFVTFLNDLLLKLKRKKSKDKFLKEFYGTTNLRWQEYFHPYPDKRMVFLMLIHLPERLLICIEQDKGPSDPEGQTLSPQENGPLSYLAGYVIRSRYQKSKNCSQHQSQRNKEIQALMFSMRTATEDNEYISSLSRGGLWSPHSWLVSIVEVSELTFRKHTNKDKVTRLPVDKIVNEVLASSLVKSLWCNIIANCDVKISKECQSLCLENVVKLYVTVRCFSFAKDIVNKYKLSEGVKRKKALRKDLKKDSELTECT